MALLDLLIVFIAVWLVLAVLWLVRQRSRTPELPERWEPRTHALAEGGYVIELVCRGEPAQPVRRISPDVDSDELGDRLAEAMAEAEARAATLNGAVAPRSGPLPRPR